MDGWMGEVSMDIIWMSGDIICRDDCGGVSE